MGNIGTMIIILHLVKNIFAAQFATKNINNNLKRINETKL